MINNMKYIKSFNESIKDFLKPKSKDDIINALNNLSPSEKIVKGAQYDIMWLFKNGIDEGGDPSTQDSWALSHAVSNNNIDMVKILLNDKRTDPTPISNFALRIAAGEGFVEIFNMLMNDDRVDPSDWDNDAIRKAYLNKHYDIVKILLKDKRVRRKLGKYMIKHYEDIIKSI